MVHDFLFPHKFQYPNSGYIKWEELRKVLYNATEISQKELLIPDTVFHFMALSEIHMLAKVTNQDSIQFQI